jgi:ankyrin repeat protein
MVRNVSLVRTLLEWNADVLALDKNNATPLIKSLHPSSSFVHSLASTFHSRISEPDPELLRLLLYDEIPTKLYSLQLPLEIAVSNGWTRSINILLDKQEPSFRDWRDSKTGETMLHLAAKRGHVETVKLLRGAGALDEATDNCGWKPLHAAAVEFHTMVVRQFTNFSMIPMLPKIKISATLLLE